MSRLGIIARNLTGTYTVTRYAAGTWTSGVFTKGSGSTVSVAGAVQPVSGREFQALPEGRRANEVRVFFTATALLTEGATPADVVSIGGESWEVFHVETWTGRGVTHYRCLVSRLAVP